MYPDTSQVLSQIMACYWTGNEPQYRWETHGSSDICLMGFIYSKFVKSPIWHLGLAMGNVRCFSPTLKATYLSQWWLILPMHNASLLSWVVKTTGRVNAVNLQQKNFLGHTVYKLVQTASQVLLSNFEVCLSQPTGSVPLSVLKWTHWPLGFWPQSQISKFQR